MLANLSYISGMTERNRPPERMINSDEYQEDDQEAVSSQQGIRDPALHEHEHERLRPTKVSARQVATATN